jgi:hypothetical protein
MESKFTSSLRFTIAILFVTSIAMARPNTASENAPSPSLTESQQVQICARGLELTCGDSIFHYVFGGGVRVSKECCSQLLNIGKECHDFLTNVTIKNEHFGEEVAKEIRRKNDKVYELCKRDGQVSN